MAGAVNINWLSYPDLGSEYVYVPGFTLDEVNESSLVFVCLLLILNTVTTSSDFT
jgi:hypothetical protein